MPSSLHPPTDSQIVPAIGIQMAEATHVQVDAGTPPELPNESSDKRSSSGEEAQDEDSSKKRNHGKEKVEGEQFSYTGKQQVASWVQQREQSCTLQPPLAAKVESPHSRAKQWFPSGTAEMTLKDEKPGSEAWGWVKVSGERAYDLFKDQLEDRTRKGRELATVLPSGKSSFIAEISPGITPNSMKGLNLQEEDPSATSTPTGDAQLDHEISPSTAAMKLERIMSSNEEFEIQWKDLTLNTQVGAGSFGTVWLGKWSRDVLSDDVAIKVLKECQDLDDERLNKFRREVEIMKRLRHPNIVLFKGAVTAPPDHLAIVTKYEKRGSLFKILKEVEQLGLQKRLEIALDVAKGMNYLHCRNPPIVHRDLKSVNIVVDTSWTAKVCDFGVSKFKPNDVLSKTRSEGTPAWMAPECIKNEPADEKSDVYSFGVVFWELMTLKTPWAGMNAYHIGRAVGYKNQRLEIPKDELHLDLSAIMEACFEAKPSDRPSFGDIVESLKDHLNKLRAQPPRGPSSSSPTPSI